MLGEEENIFDTECSREREPVREQNEGAGQVTLSRKGISI